MKPALNDLKILVVEDEAEAREILKVMLTELGITQIFEASDGQEALKFFESSPDFIDLVVCDWNMPTMTGVELLRKVRESNLNTPFLMITGRSDVDSVMEAKSSGVTAYISKPYTSKQLEAKLRVVLHKMAA